MAYGELDDARAAVAWVKKQPKIDGDRVFVFGHSAGGMLSSLMSLYSSPAVIDTGSTGGLYSALVFESSEIPFQDERLEKLLRLFGPHVSQMRQPHFACVGQDDPHPLQVLGYVRRDVEGLKVPFEWKVVAGDHFTAVGPCVRAYLERALRLMGK